MFISIHVPSWGTTEEAIDIDDDEEISIHVPSWGTTDSLCGQCDQYRISIHVPSWGTTQTDITLWIYIQNFNPRSLVGNDDGVRIVGVCISNFNPRSLVGNDGVSTETDYLKSISIHVPSWGTTANFHKYSLFFYAINIIFLLFIIPSLFSLVLFMLLF